MVLDAINAQLFMCWVIVYSNQLLGAGHTLLNLIKIIECGQKKYSV